MSALPEWTSRKEWISRKGLAFALDMSESTVDEMVRRGIIPKPVRFSPGCVRWRWASVDAALASLEGATDDASDPFMAGARNVTKAKTEGRRGIT